MKYLDAASANYYQRLHDENLAFQRNNWLVEEVTTLKGFGGKSVLELGCGNGLFLAEAALIWDKVVGVDWARSPVIDGVLRRFKNVRFEQVDVRNWAPNAVFDIVASADFFEHIAPQDLKNLIRAVVSFGRIQYHKIACYDDGHSHVSIFSPNEWLDVFAAAAPQENWRIAKEGFRKGLVDKKVICIVNENRLA